MLLNCFCDHYRWKTLINANARTRKKLTLHVDYYSDYWKALSKRWNLGFHYNTLQIKGYDICRRQHVSLLIPYAQHCRELILYNCDLAGIETTAAILHPLTELEVLRMRLCELHADERSMFDDVPPLNMHRLKSVVWFESNWEVSIPSSKMDVFIKTTF